VAVLNRNLFRDELFLEQHRADGDAQNRQPEGQAVERCGQGVHQAALVPVRPVLPRPEQENQQQREPEKPTQQKPNRHQAFGTLFGLGAGHRPPWFFEDRFHTVDPAAERHQLVARHGVQFGVGGLPAVALFVAQDRAPIQSAAPMTATIPMIHIAMPSGAGPNPPRPLPPGLCSSVTDFT
jgi:hypothetical protein